MSGFTKLVPEIIQSSIWNESPDIRCVWITLLAIKDENGYVRGDSQVISRLANIPLGSVQTALDKFQQPDFNSHTPDNEGRRISPAPGGWIVLNHWLYRGQDMKEIHAEYMRKWRKKTDVNKCDSQVITSESPSASASESASSLKSSSDSEAFTAFWQLYPHKVGKGAAVKAWRVKKCDHISDTIKAAVEKQKQWAQWQKDSGQFIPNPATWLNQERWLDEDVNVGKVDDHPRDNRQSARKSYNQAGQEIVDKLDEAALAGGDAVGRCLASCNDLYRDIPPRDGEKVVDYAYGVFKFRRSKQKKEAI